MLRPFTGEYMMSPVSLHYGMNWCSHNCFYCFANLNRPDRRSEFGSIATMLSRIINGKETKQITDALIRSQHRVMLSNDSDPFAKSNDIQFFEVKNALDGIGVQMALQTRGGEKAESTILQMKPTLIYISFTSDNEAIIKQAEGGSPSFESRKQLALAAKSAGHHVVIGMNPYQPEWWDDPYDFIEWLSANGLNYVWFGTMHISHKQAVNIKPAKANQFADVIKNAAKRGARPDDVAVNHVRQSLMHAGINVFEHGRSSGKYFWKPYFDLGAAWMPTTDEFFSKLDDLAEGNPLAVTFDNYHQWANQVLPTHQSSQFKDYLVSFGRAIRSNDEKGHAYSFKDVHEYYWRITEYPTPLRSDYLGYLTSEDAILLDDQDKEILVYDPCCGSDELFDTSQVDLRLALNEVTINGISRI